MIALNVGLAIVGLALLIALARFVLGPSALDRLVSLDAIVALAMSGLMIYAALTRNSTVVPTVVAISLVGFLGSSAVARFLGRDRSPSREERR